MAPRVARWGRADLSLQCLHADLASLRPGRDRACGRDDGLDLEAARVKQAVALDAIRAERERADAAEAKLLQLQALFNGGES